MNNLTFIGSVLAQNKEQLKETNEENQVVLNEEKSKNPKGWTDLKSVEDKIVELEKERSRTMNKKKREQYDFLLSKYQVQCKTLIKKQAEEKRKNEKKQYIINEGDPEVIEIDQEEDEEELENNLNKNKAKRKASDQIPNEKEDERINEMNKTQRVKSPEKENKEMEKSTSKVQAETTNENNKGKENKNSKVLSYKDVAKLNIEDKEEDKMKNNDTKKKNSNGEIRIRFQFQVDKNDKRNDNDILKNVLYDMMQCSKAIDASAGLITWKKDGQEKRLNGDEIKLIANNELLKYIDMTEKTNTMIKGKIYYRNGMRISTSMSVYEFTEKWGNMKYNKDNDLFKDWKPVKPAEAQNFDTAYPIGYFVGSVERGEYTTITKDIQQLLKVESEVSYQLISQRGVSNKIWIQAKEEAMKDYPNPNSSEHRRLKFAHSPSALVVYVSKTKDILQARRNITEKYGNPMEKHWPILADGSKMRFTPIFKSFVKNKKVYEHLIDMLWVQAKSKAHDVLLDLHVTDIQEKKAYLGDQSMEQIIHKKTSKKMKDAPIIKHIIKKWSRNPEAVEYQASINPYMLEEAQALLTTLKNDLTREYGNDVLQHFQNNHYRPYKKSNVKYTIKPEQEEDDYDEELVDFMLKTHTTDPYTKILVEGLDLLEKEEEKAPELITKENNNNERNDQNANKGQEAKTNVIKNKHEESPTDTRNEQGENKEQDENESTSKDSDKSPDIMSGISLGLTTEGRTVEWDNLTVTTEIEGCKPATPKEIGKIEKTILRYNITTTETEEWKNENYMEYDNILEEANGREYEILKRLVKEVLAKRTEKREIEKEEKKIQETMGLDGDEIVEETYIRGTPILLKETTSGANETGDGIKFSNTYTQRITRSRAKRVTFIQ